MCLGSRIAIENLSSGQREARQPWRRIIENGSSCPVVSGLFSASTSLSVSVLSSSLLSSPTRGRERLPRARARQRRFSTLLNKEMPTLLLRLRRRRLSHVSRIHTRAVLNPFNPAAPFLDRWTSIPLTDESGKSRECCFFCCWKFLLDPRVLNFLSIFISKKNRNVSI